MNDKKNHALCYFHAYSKVCLTISAERILRAPKLSSCVATCSYPRQESATITHMWAVGMALCLPVNRDLGTKKRGRKVARGRMANCLQKAFAPVDKMPQEQLLFFCPVAPIETNASYPSGQWLMNEDVLDQTLLKLQLLEDDSRLGILAITNLIECTDPVYANTVKSLRRIRKLAAANDGSAGLYKAYKKVFNTGSL